MDTASADDLRRPGDLGLLRSRRSMRGAEPRRTAVAVPCADGNVVLTVLGPIIAVCTFVG